MSGRARCIGHFPNREALLAAVLQSRSDELEVRRADIAQLDDALEKLGAMATLDGEIFQRVQWVAGTAHGCGEGAGTG